MASGSSSLSYWEAPPMEQVTCPQCSRLISPSETVVRHGVGLSHLACQTPRALSAHERALLAFHCWDHVVGKCSACGSHFRLREIDSDFLDKCTYSCPRCSEDLTDS